MPWYQQGNLILEDLMVADVLERQQQQQQCSHTIGINEHCNRYQLPVPVISKYHWWPENTLHIYYPSISSLLLVERGKEFFFLFLSVSVFTPPHFLVQSVYLVCEIRRQYSPYKLQLGPVVVQGHSREPPRNLT